MFNRPKFYSVYAKNDADNALESLLFVPQGFALYAFIFTSFWAFYHRLWSIGVAIFVLIMLVGFAENSQWISLSSSMAIQLAIGLYLGFEAAGLRELRLKQDGYVLMDIIMAKNELEAQQRFMDQQRIKQLSRSDSSTHTPPTAENKPAAQTALRPASSHQGAGALSLGMPHAGALPTKR